jgi:disulfide bond formation protein DsbB
MIKISPLNLAWLSLIIATSSIVIAWGFQIFGGYIPCKLCLEQRIGYYIAIPLLALALILLYKKKYENLALIVCFCAALALFASALLGGYQAGAEWQWWQGPKDCGGGNLPTVGTSIIDAMNASRLVPCDKAALRILGLSFAGWNVLAASFSGLMALATLAKRKQNQGSSSVSQ